MDNSAGVDCSDHEVNIKILVDSLVTAGKVSADERTELLMSMTDEVGALVLVDNADQNDLMGTSRTNAAEPAAGARQPDQGPGRRPRPQP